MITVVRHEIERLELAVTGSIPEIDHPDTLGFDEPDHIIGSKIACRLPEKLNQLITAHKDVIAHCCILFKWVKCKNLKMQNTPQTSLLPVQVILALSDAFFYYFGALK